MSRQEECSKSLSGREKCITVIKRVKQNCVILKRQIHGFFIKTKITVNQITERMQILNV